MTATAVAESYTGSVALVVDTGHAVDRRRPTVLSVVGGRFRILREGIISRDQVQQATPRALEE